MESHFNLLGVNKNLLFSGEKMSAPSKANAIKLDNPAQEKSSQQPVTQLHMLEGND